MGCNCGGKSDAVTAAAKVWYEVWRNGEYLGRRSDSLMTAQDLAARLGGEVRTVTS